MQGGDLGIKKVKLTSNSAISQMSEKRFLTVHIFDRLFTC
jgi:hypothetical protein